MRASHFHPINGLDAAVNGSVILPDMIFSGIMLRPIKTIISGSGSNLDSLGVI